MKGRTVIEASTSGTLGTIRIVDYISAYTDASSTRVREVVDEFLAKGISETEVYINSRGGSVVEAQQMVYELSRLPKVALQIGAVAASAGTYPPTKFFTRAYPNSSLMIHKPRIVIDGNEDQVEADLQLIKNTTQDYRASYAAKMKKTEEEVDALWAKGDYWMTGTQAKEMGLVDELVDEPLQLSGEDVDRLVAAGCPNPPAKPETQFDMKNRNQIIAALKLTADATDEQIEAAVKDAMAKAGKVDAVTAAQAQALKDEAKAFAQKAVGEKRITADVAAQWEESYIKDKAGATAMMAAIFPVEKPAPEGGDPTATGREKWDLEEWQDKDPKGLAKMASEDPEKFEKLNAAYFGA